MKATREVYSNPFFKAGWNRGFMTGLLWGIILCSAIVLASPR